VPVPVAVAALVNGNDHVPVIDTLGDHSRPPGQHGNAALESLGQPANAFVSTQCVSEANPAGCESTRVEPLGSMCVESGGACPR
jgi:hypothetical protein